MPTPKLAFPIRFAGGRPVTVEQDSLDEIAQCVEVALRYPVGFRHDLPEFGTPDQTFRMNGADPDAIRRAVARWEPRVEALVDERPDVFDALVSRVTVEARGGEQ